MDTFIISSFAGIALMLLLLEPLSGMFATTAIVMFSWGLCYMVFSAALQYHLFEILPGDAAPVAMSVYSGLFNVGIATGTILGGSVMSDFGIQNIGFAGSAFAAVSTILLLTVLLPMLRRKKNADVG